MHPKPSALKFGKPCSQTALMAPAEPENKPNKDEDGHCASKIEAFLQLGLKVLGSRVGGFRVLGFRVVGI